MARTRHLKLRHVLFDATRFPQKNGLEFPQVFLLTFFSLPSVTLECSSPAALNSMEKQESVGDDRDELDVESVIAEENIDPSIFSIRNALEQPDARVYTTLELHSKPSALKISAVNVDAVNCNVPCSPNS